MAWQIIRSGGYKEIPLDEESLVWMNKLREKLANRRRSKKEDLKKH